MLELRLVFQWLMVQTQVRIAQCVKAEAGVPMVDASSPD